MKLYVHKRTHKEYREIQLHFTDCLVALQTEFLSHTKTDLQIILDARITLIIHCKLTHKVTRLQHDNRLRKPIFSFLIVSAVSVCRTSMTKWNTAITLTLCKFSYKWQSQKEIRAIDFLKA
jgi:hypothetical protein